jgi:uncharacterized protein (TIGR03000 family)
MTRTLLPLAVAALLFASAPAPAQGIRPIARPIVSAPDVRPFLPGRQPGWAVPPGLAYPTAPWFGGYYGGFYGGYYPGYYGDYYPYLGSSTSFYYPPAPLTAPPLTGAGGTGSGSAATVVVNPEQPAELTVEFPAAPDVTLNGAAAEGEGTARTFRSPPLKPGETYTFDVKAKWTVDGKRYEWDRTVTLGAGERSRLTVARGFPVKD